MKSLTPTMHLVVEARREAAAGGSARAIRRSNSWSGPLGPDLDQADLTVDRAVFELLWTEIAQGGIETRSVVDLVDEPRALTGKAPGGRVFLEKNEIEVTAPEQRRLLCFVRLLPLWRFEPEGRAFSMHGPAAATANNRAKPPTSDQPPGERQRAPDRRSTVSRLCAFPADLPTAPSDLW